MKNLYEAPEMEKIEITDIIAASTTSVTACTTNDTGFTPDP